MSNNKRLLKYISIVFLLVKVLSSFALGQSFIQSTGYTAETLIGRISVYNVHGLQYGLRVGAWPMSWVSVGLETFTANNLQIKRLVDNKFSSQSEQLEISHNHIFVGFHLRKFKYIKPYVIGTYGRSNEPEGRIEYNESTKISSLNRSSITVRTGLAFEIQRVRFAFEIGGGSMGSGHSETNMSLGYMLKRLPEPNKLSNFTISSGLQKFAAITGPYKGEDFTGFDINLEVDKNGRIREYNVGIFFTNDGHFSTGVFNIGTGWHINSNHKFFDYFDVVPGVQMLIWAEGNDFILPAASLGLNSHYQFSRLVPFVRLRALATYSRDNGFISGFTSTYGIGLAF